MAIKKVQKNRMNESGEYDQIYYQTSADQVLMNDGTTAEEKIASKADLVNGTVPTDQLPTDLVTTPSGGELTMAAEIGSGPYVIEFTEEEEAPFPSASITYDGASSGLSSADVQSAIDELVLEKQDVISGTQGQVVGFGADGKPLAQDAPSSIPEGGTPGQVLTKKSETDYDTEWKDAPTGQITVNATIDDASNVTSISHTYEEIEAAIDSGAPIQAYVTAEIEGLDDLQYILKPSTDLRGDGILFHSIVEGTISSAVLYIGNDNAAEFSIVSLATQSDVGAKQDATMIVTATTEDGETFTGFNYTLQEMLDAINSGIDVVFNGLDSIGALMRVIRADSGFILFTNQQMDTVYMMEVMDAGSEYGTVGIFSSNVLSTRRYIVNVTFSQTDGVTFFDGSYEKIYRTWNAHEDVSVHLTVNPDPDIIVMNIESQNSDIGTLTFRGDVSNGYWELTIDSSDTVSCAFHETQSALPVNVEILETICENLELTDDNPSYTFPEAITLDEDGLYHLDYKRYDSNGNLHSMSGFSRPVSGEDSLSATWMHGSSYSVTLTSTEITDNGRLSGHRSVLTIVKVNLTITDELKFDAANREGFNTIASGYASHAEGYATIASGSYGPHAEGYATIASGTSSHAEGCDTTASGYASHAEGYYTEATYDSTHAEGEYTTANGYASHAEGYATIAGGRYQHVQGRYNIEDSDDKYAHIVGNGTSVAPSNAHTLDWDGNAWFAGKVYIGGTGQDDGEELAVKPKATTVTLTTSGWTLGTDGRYYQTVSVDGVTADTPVIIVNAITNGEDQDADTAMLDAWEGPRIWTPKQGDGTLTFYSLEVPDVSIEVGIGICQ